VKVRTILVAEDNENDSFLLERAFKEADLSNPLQIVRDGQQAVDYLSGASHYADRNKYPWPCLLLLDLQMPRMDGFGVLSWWREKGRSQELPIVVMSSSDLESDLCRAIDLGATAYLVKPSSFNYLVTVARQLRDRWLEPVPRKSEAIREV
jgi:DNA-binding response OmpR family regulator